MAVIVFYVSLGNSFTPIDKSELTVISVVVKDEINANLGRRSDFGARFFSTNHACEFGLSKGGGIASGWKILSEFKHGDTLELQIRNSSLNRLTNQHVVVSFYSMAFEGRPIFSVEEYNESSILRERRVNFFLRFIAFLGLIHGFKLASIKTRFVIVGIFAVSVLAMRIFRFWLY
jgi:hypothetical protein